MAGFNSDSKFKGDFCTPEQEIPASGLPGVDWESCMTMNGTWGYSAHDHAWKSTETLVRNLIDIVSKGGNYLLNVGPTAEGLIPEASVERLKAMGAWMKVNGESIHGSTASPFPKAPAWGRCTTRALPNGNTRLYLHVFNWPADGKLVVNGLANEALGAKLLALPDQALTATRQGSDLLITVPATAPDATASVIALEIKGKPEIGG
jgi:alpha-L-fucosidase